MYSHKLNLHVYFGDDLVMKEKYIEISVDCLNLIFSCVMKGV